MLFENIRLSLSCLLANKTRTLLTMLGIMIGTASVIAIMTISDAMGNSVKDSMGNMGVDDISFYLEYKPGEDGETDYENIREKKETDYFRAEMFETLQSHFKNRIKGIVLTKEMGSAYLSGGKQSTAISITGANYAALDKQKLTLLAGRFFTPEEYHQGKSVVIVSDKYVNKFYDNDAEAAIGKTLETVLNNSYNSYTIVGVYESVDASGMFSLGSSTRLEGYVPLKNALLKSRTEPLFDSFTVIADSGQDADLLLSDMLSFLNTAYYAKNDSYEAYGYSMKAQIKEMTQLLNTVKIAFMAIAGISLLVGGIGVMNIMIVSITERTREIGTRKALGATNRLIRMQFITESVTVCLLGGILGTGMGVLLGAVVSRLMNFGGKPSVPGILISVLFSAAIGVFFGYYPANKAAKLNPIEALRYE